MDFDFSQPIVGTLDITYQITDIPTPVCFNEDAFKANCKMPINASKSRGIGGRTLKNVLTSDSSIPSAIQYHDLEVTTCDNIKFRLCDMTGVRASYREPHSKMLFSLGNYHSVMNLPEHSQEQYLEMRGTNKHAIE